MGRARKRPRNQDGNPDNPNERLLQNNPFAMLPEDVEVAPIEKKEKVPPLFTTSKEVGLIRNELAKHQIHPLFKLCSMGTKILCSTLNDYSAVKEFLKVNRFEFYTHDVPGSKPFKVVLRGLPSLLVAEVKAELVKVGLKPTEVFAITRRGEGKVYRDHLYLVHFEKGSTNLAALQQVRALFHIVVHWEKYRPKHRDVTQCTNCLGFGHGTKNCHMKTRCGKCAGPHSTATCLQGDEDEPKCANCGSNHHGSDRKCPKRADFIQIRQQASTRNQQGRKRVPARTEENFPALAPRHPVPVLPPLPLNTPSSAPSVQDRLATAAASTPLKPPGLSGAWPQAPNPPSDYSTFYPSDVILELTLNLYKHLSACRSKEDQIRAATTVVTNFLGKYGP